MEINKETPFNPIIQDTKKGKPRFYHSDSTVNYGAFPQTWEDPTHADLLVPEFKGDNGASYARKPARIEPFHQTRSFTDPTDVIDVSQRVSSTGDIYVVKVIGALGMVDGGELDWKIVVIDVADPLATEVDDIHQLADDHPLSERLAAIRDWFRDYKLPDGKPVNEFSNEGKYYGKADALQVVNAQHDLWVEMVRKPRPASAKLWWEMQPNAG
jgi:inorganic pyrophosphatase